jgi:hypothetical protein
VKRIIHMVVTDPMRFWAAEHAPDVPLGQATQEWADQDEQFDGPWAYPVAICDIRSWMAWMAQAQAALGTPVEVS